MKEHTEQHLDSLSKKVMQSSRLESPSVDFTANIMSIIEAPETDSITTYQPLISKRTWLILAIFVLGVLAYLFNIESSQSSGLLDKIDYSIITNNKISNAITGVNMSTILTYAITFFGLAWAIQVTLLKYQFNKRLEY